MKGFRLNTGHVIAGAIVLVSCIASVTILTIFDKDSSSITSLIQTIATVAGGLFSLYAASKVQAVHDKTEEVSVNVNGRMTQLIDSLANSTPTKTDDVENEVE